ncbi:MAG TPA: hypothetical protein ENJ89_09010 [Caldithrix abyssi]|uniref:Uncharacterized protein n=1 Tax=Caldithrix abyssi TaxID=187145 RepID=A0A7V5PQF1_CALAY|nr:hypothetical protein [Caldithrix abyssi]
MVHAAKARTRIVVFLYLVALHSLAIGLGLIFLPAVYLKYFGFVNGQSGFFQAQGGVFHLVMVAAYWMAARRIDRSSAMVLFSIVAKSMGAVFLLIYFFLVEQAWIVIVSALGDGIMAVLIWWLYRQYRIARQGAP